MIKIPYPNPSVDFDNEYINKIWNSNSTNFSKANRYLSSLTYNGKKLNIKYLLTAKFHELLEISELIENGGLSKIKKKNFARLFNYSKNQSKIASFFMHQSHIEIESCYFCNIDYVNAFKNMADYKDTFDFINNAPKHELFHISGVSDITADKIIANRIYKSINDVPHLTNKAKKQIASHDFLNSHNHFTLDHFLHQSRYKYLSLCLYNLVPSCYSCNSKFKKDHSFTFLITPPNLNPLLFVSPSSKDFSLSKDLNLSIYFPKNFKSIKSKKDFILQFNINSNQDIVRQYINLFKLEGRYVFHKKEILNLIDKKIRYPESKLKNISRMHGISLDKLRQDIFGYELYDSKSHSKPLVKMRRDVAKNIRIKGVI